MEQNEDWQGSSAVLEKHVRVCACETSKSNKGSRKEFR